jgi:hypothetical protein
VAAAARPACGHIRPAAATLLLLLLLLLGPGRAASHLARLQRLQLCSVLLLALGGEARHLLACAAAMVRRPAAAVRVAQQLLLRHDAQARQLLRVLLLPRRLRRLPLLRHGLLLAPQHARQPGAAPAADAAVCGGATAAHAATAHGAAVCRCCRPRCCVCSIPAAACAGQRGRRGHAAAARA